jgi:hypothetical protein
MSATDIPTRVKIRLWGKAAGRCQYEGCNKPLWQDNLTKVEFNIAYIAHIIADKPDGPRGDEELSKELASDMSNLMLMCDEHHRLIDKEDIEGHPVERLRVMKKEHEERIEILGSLQKDRRSHLLLYGANIGEHSSPLTWEKVVPALYPNRYPAEKPSIDLGFKNSAYQDHEKEYWQIEKVNLERQFERMVRPKLISGEVNHLSIFALAPMPLLAYLGRLISDIPAAEIYQLHREPPDWCWQEEPDEFEYILSTPAEKLTNVAINLSFSGTINNERITHVLGADTSIWSLSINEPYNDFLKAKGQLELFRKTYKRLLDRIKAVHGEDKVIHIFPAVPVSIAVEIGRVRMPKADLPMRIYDKNSQNSDFVFALDIA